MSKVVQNFFRKRLFLRLHVRPVGTPPARTRFRKKICTTGIGGGMNRLLLLLSFALVGCSYSTYYVPLEQAVYPPTDPSGVVVSTQKEVHSNHKKIGRVATIVWGDGEDARESLQREAARAGANAIIDLRLEKAFFRTSASGIAVIVYKNWTPTGQQ